MPAHPSAIALGKAWKQAAGVPHVPACALVAAFTAAELDGFPVWPSAVTALVELAGGPSRAGEALVDLVRLGLLIEAGQVHQVPLYRVTEVGRARVREWAGRGAAEVAA